MRPEATAVVGQWRPCARRGVQDGGQHDDVVAAGDQVSDLAGKPSGAAGQPRRPGVLGPLDTGELVPASAREAPGQLRLVAAESAWWLPSTLTPNGAPTTSRLSRPDERS